VIEYFKRLLRQLLDTVQKQTPMKEHDYRRSVWGHSCNEFSPGVFAGFGRGINRGDVLVCTLRSGGVGRFRVLKIEYMTDPTDQWFADVVMIEKQERE